MARLNMVIDPSMTAAVLLAAGSGARFGGDKLAMQIGGECILSLSAKSLAKAGCYRQAAIVSKASFAQDQLLNTLDFDVAVNPHSEQGISTSIRLGVAWAEEQDAQAILIALADMPFVTPAHYLRLFETINRSQSGLAYSWCGDKRSPPAIFSRSCFPQLSALEGDVGARDLLRAAPLAAGVEAPQRMLADIDTRADLKSVQPRR